MTAWFICWGCNQVMADYAHQDEQGNFWHARCWAFAKFCRDHPGAN